MDLADVVGAVQSAVSTMQEQLDVVRRDIAEVAGLAVASSGSVVKPGRKPANQQQKNSEEQQKEKGSGQAKKNDEDDPSERRRRGIFDSLQQDVSRGFSRAFNRVLVEGRRFRDALRDIARDVLEAFLDTASQLAFNWLRTQIEMTFAAKVGAQERKQAEQGGLIEVKNLHAESAVEAIATDAVQGEGGVFAFLAPIMGPFAASPAAIAGLAVAALAGSIAFAERGFDVPADTLAYLHKDEMVLPAALAERIRGLSEPRGRAPSGPTIGQVVIHATDADSFKRMLRRNPGAIADAMMAAHRGFKPMKL